MYYYRLQINWVSLTKNVVVTLCDSCEVRTESHFHFVVVTVCDSCEVRTESRFHFVVVTLRDSCEVRTEFRFHFVVVSTLLQDILHPSHRLLNVLLQIANKFGLCTNYSWSFLINGSTCYDSIKKLTDVSEE
jgi:hypothetical protein